MILHTVDSAAIHAIGYDRESRIMEVIFTGGGIYLFRNVPPQVFEGFVRSGSKGAYFQQNVRGAYGHQRLGRFRQRRVARPSIPN